MSRLSKRKKDHFFHIQKFYMDSPEQFFPEFHLTFKMLIYLVGLLFWAPWLRLVPKCSNSNLKTHFHSSVNSTVSAFQLVAIPLFMITYFPIIYTYPLNIHTHIFPINPNIHTHLSPPKYKHICVYAYTYISN